MSLHSAELFMVVSGKELEVHNWNMWEQSQKEQKEPLQTALYLKQLSHNILLIQVLFLLLQLSAMALERNISVFIYLFIFIFFPLRHKGSIILPSFCLSGADVCHPWYGTASSELQDIPQWLEQGVCVFLSLRLQHSNLDYDVLPKLVCKVISLSSNPTQALGLAIKELKSESLISSLFLIQVSKWLYHTFNFHWMTPSAYSSN